MTFKMLDTDGSTYLDYNETWDALVNFEWSGTLATFQMMWKLGVKSPGVYLEQFSDMNQAGLGLVPGYQTRDEVCSRSVPALAMANFLVTHFIVPSSDGMHTSLGCGFRTRMNETTCNTSPTIGACSPPPARNTASNVSSTSNTTLGVSSAHRLGPHGCRTLLPAVPVLLATVALTLAW
uniref:EF-hand domain-containing protein n=1 Tax=Eutreptiella gymnastica TaxID=73025 RepID=A0A7S1NEQ1_9EUGL